MEMAGTSCHLQICRSAGMSRLFTAASLRAGAQIGVLLNRAVPAPITLLLMALILSLTAVFTLAKGRDLAEI